MGPWLSLISAAAVALAPPTPDDPARNQCRAACAGAWVINQQCKAVKDAVKAEPPAVCLKRADKTYRACIAACDPAGAAEAAKAKAP